MLDLKGGPATLDEIYNRLKKLGSWSETTIYFHMVMLTVNCPPAYHLWKNNTRKFLFLRPDGKYELYNPKKHGEYQQGTRLE